MKNERRIGERRSGERRVVARRASGKERPPSLTAQIRSLNVKVESHKRLLEELWNVQRMVEIELAEYEKQLRTKREEQRKGRR